MNNKPNRQKQDQDEEKARQERMRRQIRFSVGYIITALIAVWLFQQFFLSPLLVQATEIPYSQFKSMLKSGQIVDVNIGDTNITGDMKNPSTTSSQSTVPFTTVAVPTGDPTLIQELDTAGVKYTNQPPPSPIGQFLLAYILPLAFIGGVYYFLFRRISGGGGGASSDFRGRQEQGHRGEARRGGHHLQRRGRRG